MSELYRLIPKMDQLLSMPQAEAWLKAQPRALVTDALRQTLEDLRRRIGEGTLTEAAELEPQRVLALAGQALGNIAQPSFRRLVNATGVVIHTNLGRSPLAEAALEAVAEAGRWYSNLEFDLATGRRGSRYAHVLDLLTRLTGAEAGLVVNNNAAAVFLTLNTLAAGREVIVSRGELVEIGGSFRIPEVMAQSGARLREVGATNKTHPRDYEAAINENTGLIMKVHQSNFHMVGFTRQTTARELAPLARAHGLPLVEDLGSGSLVDFSRYGLIKEPTVQETISAGVDVVTFSGDKLLGGPQAGLILGRAEHIERIRANPINRALRIDKFTLAALEATLRLYLDEEEAMRQVPILKMITTPEKTLRDRANRLRRRLAQAAPSFSFEVKRGLSRIGGGALPLQELKTALVAVAHPRFSSARLEAWLRTRPVPVIGRIEQERFLMDPRTMEPGDQALAVQAFKDLESQQE